MRWYKLDRVVICEKNEKFLMKWVKAGLMPKELARKLKNEVNYSEKLKRLNSRRTIVC
jgi:hypothetical protein